MTTTAERARIAEARDRKASRLAYEARHATRTDGVGYTSEEVAEFSDAAWATLEALAGTRPASETTRQQTIEVIARLEARDARAADPADPFEGL